MTVCMYLLKPRGVGGRGGKSLKSSPFNALANNLESSIWYLRGKVGISRAWKIIIMKGQTLDIVIHMDGPWEDC